MRKIITALSMLVFFGAFQARAENMCESHRNVIVRASEMSGREMKDIKFPLPKQIFTATVSAIGAIPDLVGYLIGRKDGFLDFCVVEFKHRGETFTCVATVNIKPDNSQNVNIANCGENSWKFFKQGAFLDTLQVYGLSNSNKQKSTSMTR